MFDQLKSEFQEECKEATVKEELKTHEFAGIFRMMGADEYATHMMDIKNKGQLVPIVTFEGRILDGRNTYKACKELGVDPIFENYKGDDPLGFVISRNAIRRHLDASQLAAVALDFMPQLKKEAVERQKTGKGSDGSGGRGRKRNPTQKVGEGFDRHTGEVVEQAAKMVGINRQYIADAKKIKEEDPKAFEEIRQGTKTIKEAKWQQKQKQLEGRNNSLPNVPLPEGEHDVILIDPPHKYQFCPTNADRIENHYPTMELDDLKKLKIPSAKDSILYLWSPPCKVEESIQMMNAWGFTYKSCAVWDKQRVGRGFWFRIQHELLLVGIKGNFPTPAIVNLIPSVYSEKRREHSRKPDYFYQKIEKMYPNRKFFEMFGRTQYSPRWIVWGNQVNHFPKHDG
jgi:N6-adenosine-specific RNA methylase IME4